MKNMPKSQQRALVILGLIVLLVFLVMLALMNLSAFFVLLVLLVLGVCLLRMKKPECFSLFSKEKKPEEAAPETDEKRREAFSARVILLYQGGVTTRQISVDREEFTIGRSESCNFVLPGNTNISRVHAVIRYDREQDRSTITDQNSSHGTKVNGERLTPGEPRTLHNGDLIQIEDRILTVQNKNY